MENNDNTIENIINKLGLEITSKYIYFCFLNNEIGNTIFCSVQNLDDMYCGIVGGVFGNFGSGKTPVYIDGIGPSESERNSKECFDKLKEQLAFGIGMKIYPYETWKTENCDIEKWSEILNTYTILEQEYDNDQMKWLINIRNKFIYKQLCK